MGAFIFAVDDFDVVAQIVKLRRKRQMSETQKQAAGERLAKYQFTKQLRSPEQFTEPRTASGAPA